MDFLTQGDSSPGPSKIVKHYNIYTYNLMRSYGIKIASMAVSIPLKINDIHGSNAPLQ